MAEPTETPTALFRLASPVFLFVATFQRQARRGAALKGDVLHEEAERLFRERDAAAGHEPGLGAFWALARRALVCLTDEVMTATEWDHRGWWDSHTLEARILNNPQKMRGILFFDDLAQARRMFDERRTAAGSERAYAADLLAVFYCCLKFGFRGKFVGQPQELTREADAILALLCNAPVDDQACFPQAYQHTIEIPPNYKTVMRLATVAAMVIAAVCLLVGFRGALWNDLLQGLETAAEQAGTAYGVMH